MRPATFRHVGTKMNETDPVEALNIANMDWDVIKRTMQTVEEFDEKHLPAPNFRGIYRVDNNVNLGMVSPTYEIVQNSEAIKIIDDIREAGMPINITHAGSIFGGERLFLSLDVGEPIMAGSEMFTRMIVISWGHNGSISLRASFMLIRCATGAMVSLDIPGVTNELKFRHTKNVHSRVRMASKILKKAASYFDTIKEKMTLLSTFRMLDSEFKTYLESLFPGGESNRSTTAAKNKRSKVFDLFRSATEQTKLHGAIAVSEYCHGDKSTRVCEGREKGEVELNGMLFGNRAKEATQAFKDMLSSVV